MVSLIADGGEITVGRQVASYVYGAWEVTAPDDVDTPDDDERVSNGFIYRPDDMPRGRFDIGFVRADASMDMQEETSTTEHVITTAEKRVSGEVFFEREITGAGLGRWIPGKHFRQGDVVDVRLWSRTMRLPVTAIDLATSDEGPLQYRVHVGGQMIADAEALRQHNDKIVAAIAADRRKAAKATREAGRRADRAQATADSIRADLGNPDGSTGGLFANYLAKLGEEGDVTRDLLRINAALWDEQYGWNATQEAINAAQQQINELTEQRLTDQEQAVEGLRRAQAEAQLTRVFIGHVTKTKPLTTPLIDARYSGRNLVVTGRGTWSGTIYATVEVELKNTGDGPAYTYPTYTTALAMPNPTGGRTHTLTKASFLSALVQWTVNAGVQQKFVRNQYSRVVPRATWTVLEDLTFTAPQSGEYMVVFKVTWRAVATLTNYGIDIERNGQYLKTTGLVSRLFTSKDFQLTIMSGDSTGGWEEGDVIAFRVLSDASTEGSRTVDSASVSITWIEG